MCGGCLIDANVMKQLKDEFTKWLIIRLGVWNVNDKCYNLIYFLIRIKVLDAISPS